MTVLILESNPDLATIWGRHIEIYGHHVTIAATQSQAIRALQSNPVSLLIVNVLLTDGSALAVADYASYRFPSVQIVFVTARSFFSDGSIFNHVANARAYLSTATPPGDLAAMADHYLLEGQPRP